VYKNSYTLYYQPCRRQSVRARARARPVLFLFYARNLYFRAERITFRYARIARFLKRVHVMNLIIMRVN